MGMEFYFEYVPAEKSRYEVKEAGGGYQALMNCQAEILQKAELWAPFVAEFRGDWATLGETTGEEAPDMAEYDEEELMDMEAWGPSQAYEPAVFKKWALRWITILEALTDEQAKRLFPYDHQLHSKEGAFGRNDEINDLREVVQQADCATIHGALMRMHMVMG